MNPILNNVGFILQVSVLNSQVKLFGSIKECLKRKQKQNKKKKSEFSAVNANNLLTKLGIHI